MALFGCEIGGAITAVDKGVEAEWRVFYVAPGMQGRDMGGALWMKAMQFSRERGIHLMTYPHNTRTLRMYKK